MNREALQDDLKRLVGDLLTVEFNMAARLIESEDLQTRINYNRTHERRKKAERLLQRMASTYKKKGESMYIMNRTPSAIAAQLTTSGIVNTTGIVDDSPRFPLIALSLLAMFAAQGVRTIKVRSVAAGAVKDMRAVHIVTRAGELAAEVLSQASRDGVEAPRMTALAELVADYCTQIEEACQPVNAIAEVASA